MPDVSARTVIRAAVGEGSGYNALRRDYVIIGDGERERAAQPTPREIVAPLHERIAERHPALVAAFKAIPPWGGRATADLKAIEAWKREHRAAIEEAKAWPR
jgi:hypothetical protein